MRLTSVRPPTIESVNTGYTSTKFIISIFKKRRGRVELNKKERWYAMIVVENHWDIGLVQIFMIIVLSTVRYTHHNNWLTCNDHNNTFGGESRAIELVDRDHVE